MRNKLLSLCGLLVATSAFAGHVQVMIELQAPPAVESYLHAAGRSPHAVAAATRAQLAVIANEQAAVVQRLQVADDTATELYRVQRVYNGIAADVDESRIDAIRQLPGVKAVHPLDIVPMANTSSVPLIGAPIVWKALTNGATGKGIRVGVIDTGIDYIHRDFGGSGDYSTHVDFAGATFPTNAKVAGGVDLAGDDYDGGSSDPAKRTPHPDGDPMDCAGHGSHVSGTIGGLGVLKDGTTYTGGYSSVDESTFLIGPGVAPDAQLYAIRVFGCSGSTGLIAQGLEWALDPNGDGDFSDKMDVVNMSLGSGYGSKLNPSAVAADNLARAGTIVVASAGNDGDTYFITASPAAADRAISVASSVDALVTADGLRVDAPSAIGGVYPANFSVNYDWIHQKSAVSGSVIYPATLQTGCSAFPAAAFTGKIALLDWTDNDCGSKVRTDNAAKAGAIGVILRSPRSVLDFAIAGDANIPTVLVTLDTGNLIQTNISSAAVTLTADLLGTQPIITNANIDKLSSFTSRGPRIDDAAIKPEITAPGDTIFSVLNGSGFRGTTLSGTSMAAPHVTGAMALLKQLHPDWNQQELKALVMNTASHDLYTGDTLSGFRYGVSRIGAGRIDVASASLATGVAYNAAANGVVGVSFGTPDVSGTLTTIKNITVENKSANAVTWSVSYDSDVAQPGVTFSVPPSLSVPPNGIATLPVTMQATASAMRHHREDSLTTQQNSVTREWLTEASGFVTLTSGATQTLRVPVLAVPRAVSTMHAVEKPLIIAGNMTLHLAGSTIATGPGLEDENAVVTAFELTDMTAQVAGLANVPYANLKYVGVTSDFPAQQSLGKNVVDSTIEFAIVTYGAWATPAEAPVKINIDTNGDGTFDYSINTTNLAVFTSTSNSSSDVFIASICPSSGSPCKQQYLNVIPASIGDAALFNTNVMVIPVRAADIGLTNSSSRFRYQVTTGRGAVVTPIMTYDVAAPGLTFSGSPAAFGFPDAPTTAINIAFNPAAYQANGDRGILLLHHLNADGTRDEVVTLTPATKHRAAK